MNKITRKGYNNCLHDIVKLKKRVAQVVERIRNARKYGDFSENSELISELKTKKQLDINLSKLIAITASCEIVSLCDIVDHKVIQVGATVTVTVNNNCLLTFQIVGEYESDIENKKISYKTPFASVLIGKKAKDKFIYQEKQYVVKKISYVDII